jgi:lambda family phage portal protein
MAWGFFGKAAKKTRYGRSFNAAAVGRTIDIGQTKSINADLAGSLEVVRGRCRQLAQNDPYIGKALQLWKNNIVGATGIDLHVQGRKSSGAQDKVANDAIELHWADFMRYGCPTTCGTLSGVDAMKLIIESVARDGECLVAIRRGKQYGKQGYQLDLIPIEQFSSVYHGIASNGNTIFQSVEVDSNMRPVAYWINSVPQNGQRAAIYSAMTATPDTRILAEDCLHIFEKHYIGQLRGFPWIVSAVLNLHHLDMYKLTELENARLAAANKIFFTAPVDEGGLAEESIEKMGTMHFDHTSAGISSLPQGWDVKSVSWDCPNANMPDFVRTQLKGIAAGMGLSYASVANDLEKVNFSSSKYAALEDQTSFQNKQRWFIDCFVDRVYCDWLKYQLMTNRLNLPFAKYQKYCNVKFTPRGFRSVNLMETARAALILNNMGLASLTQISSEMFGLDWEETLQQLTIENDLLGKAGIKLPSQVDVLKLEMMAETPDTNNDN